MIYWNKDDHLFPFSPTVLWIVSVSEERSSSKKIVKLFSSIMNSNDNQLTKHMCPWHSQRNTLQVHNWVHSTSDYHCHQQNICKEAKINPFTCTTMFWSLLNRAPCVSCMPAWSTCLRANMAKGWQHFIFRANVSTCQ